MICVYFRFQSTFSHQPVQLLVDWIHITSFTSSLIQISMSSSVRRGSQVLLSWIPLGLHFYGNWDPWTSHCCAPVHMLSLNSHFSLCTDCIHQSLGNSCVLIIVSPLLCDNSRHTTLPRPLQSSPRSFAQQSCFRVTISCVYLLVHTVLLVQYCTYFWNCIALSCCYRYCIKIKAKLWDL